MLMMIKCINADNDIQYFQWKIECQPLTMPAKISVSIVICLIVTQSVYGLFWDFSRPTNNAGQAAAGGAFLGAAGILTLCWVKDNCRGKRETDAANNVR